MTTQEATIEMISRLSKDEQLSVQKYIKSLFAMRKKRYELKPLTRKEFTKLIESSMDDAKHGRVHTIEEVERSARTKYGL